MNYQLAAAILKNKWAIELQFAMNSAGLVADILAGNVDVQDRAQEENKPLAVSIDARKNHSAGGYTYWDWDDAPEGSVALIRLQGSLMKNTQSCGPVGMAVIGERFREADKNPNFAGILLHIDSPGGTVDGTQTLADIVKSTRKPVVAFVDGLMASAALWVGSSANEIWASTPDDEVGSVGVLMSFMDIQPYWESLGVKFHTVTASQSTDKVKMWEDLRAGKYDDYKKEFLDPIAQTFIDNVKQNRPGVSDEHLTGKLYLAKNSIGVFVDHIGTFVEAIDRVYQLSEGYQAHSRTGSGQAAQHYSPKTTVMKQFSHVNAALGVDSLEAVDGVASLNEQQLEALDNALAADSSAPLQAELDSANQTIAERDASITGLQGQLSSANADVAQRDATIARLTQQVKDLKGEAADPGAKAHKTTDGKPSAGVAIADKHENPFDALDEISQEYLGKKLND